MECQKKFFEGGLNTEDQISRTHKRHPAQSDPAVHNHTRRWVETGTQEFKGGGGHGRTAAPRHALCSMRACPPSAVTITHVTRVLGSDLVLLCSADKLNIASLCNTLLMLQLQKASWCMKSCLCKWQQDTKRGTHMCYKDTQGHRQQKPRGLHDDAVRFVLSVTRRRDV